MHDLKELKDAGEAGADDEHRAEEALQKLTDEKVEGARRPPQGQGSRDPRGVSATYVAIIMDGNGRWAHQHGVPVAEGHKAGADTVKARLRDAVDLGVRELTIYSFSTENWSRPQDEVDALMALFSARIIDETPELHEEGVKMRFVGRREGVLPGADRADGVGGGQDRREHADHAVRRLQLRRALGDPRRGGAVHGRRRGGVPRAALRARDARPGPADPHLAASSGSPTTCCGRPRTRELHFTDVLWPDFSRADFEEALASYEARVRRFGGR